MDSYNSIGDEGFVVHPTVHFSVVAEKIHRLSKFTVSYTAWVVESDVKMRMLADGGKIFIVSVEPDVIDEESDADSSLGCFDESIIEQGSAMVVGPEESLNVD